MGQISSTTTETLQKTGKYVEPSIGKELGDATVPPNFGTFAIPKPKETKTFSGPLNYQENPNYRIRKDVGGGEIKSKNMGGWTVSTNLYSPENIKKYTDYGFSIEDALKIIAAQNPGTTNPALITENTPLEEVLSRKENTTTHEEVLESGGVELKKNELPTRDRVRNLLGRKIVTAATNQEALENSLLKTKQEPQQEGVSLTPQGGEVSETIPLENPGVETSMPLETQKDLLELERSTPEPVVEVLPDEEQPTVSDTGTTQELHIPEHTQESIENEAISTTIEQVTQEESNPFKKRLQSELSPSVGENAEIINYKTSNNPSRIVLPQEKAALRTDATGQLMETLFQRGKILDHQETTPAQQILRLSNPLLLLQTSTIPENIPHGLETKKNISWKEGLEEDTKHILNDITIMGEKDLITTYVPLYVNRDNPSSWAAVSDFSACEILNGDENVYGLKHNEGARIEISTLIKHLGLIDEASDTLSDNPKYTNSNYSNYEDYLSKNPRITIHDYDEEIRRKVTEANNNERK